MAVPVPYYYDHCTACQNVIPTDMDHPGDAWEWDGKTEIPRR